MPAQELEATFAARGHTVDYLLDSLRKQVKSGTLSSYVITGPRGSGKSTIIQMVALRGISQDSEAKLGLDTQSSSRKSNSTSAPCET